MSERYILSFYLEEEGDLGITDVNFAGSFSDARIWARQRLEYLASAARRSHELQPRQCVIKDADGAPMLVIELL